MKLIFSWALFFCLQTLNTQAMLSKQPLEKNDNKLFGVIDTAQRKTTPARNTTKKDNEKERTLLRRDQRMKKYGLR